MAAKHEECEKCEEHKAWEEKMKLLGEIPGILTWMNSLKGSMKILVWVITISVPILFTLIVATRTEIFTKIREHEETIDRRQDRMSEQVKAISQDASAIRTDVAVMVRTLELTKKEYDKEFTVLKDGMRVK